jgi:hypothetical protein
VLVGNDADAVFRAGIEANEFHGWVSGGKSGIGYWVLGIHVLGIGYSGMGIRASALYVIP